MTGDLPTVRMFARAADVPGLRGRHKIRARCDHCGAGLYVPKGDRPAAPGQTQLCLACAAGGADGEPGAAAVMLADMAATIYRAEVTRWNALHASS